MTFKLPKLDKTMHVVVVEIYDPTTGKVLTGYGTADPDFQRWWQSSAIRSDGAVPLTSLVYNGTASGIYNQSNLQGAMDMISLICRALSGK